MKDEHIVDAVYMRQALLQAQKAAALGEVPIGSVIVREGKIIARGYNRRNTDKNVLSHAETNALRKATRVTGDWRLEDCTLYVTLEPCQMCAGAIVQARVKRVVVGAMNPKAGCAGSILNLLQMEQFNHQVELTTGILESECAALLTSFFGDLRLGAEAVKVIDHPVIHRKKAEHGRRKRTAKKQYKVLLWDIDGTILNFLEAEKAAIRNCFAKFDLGECTDEMLARYSAINRRYWETMERGEITKDQVLIGRFEEFFTLEGLEVAKAAPFNKEYQVRLGDTCVFNDDSYEIIRRLKGHVLQYGVTNGTLTAQTRKLAVSGLGDLFDGVFISDQIGFEKPSPEFFAPLFTQLESLKAEGRLPEDLKKDEILIIGDSLTSDMQGGNNAGIAACWYNPAGKSNDKGVRIDYEIKDLHQVIPISGVRFKE